MCGVVLIGIYAQATNASVHPRSYMDKLCVGQTMELTDCK